MLNNLSIMGRLTADPEVKSVGGNNRRVANFRIAVDSDFKDQNGNRKTAFLECQAWGPNADYIGKYFTKGRMIIVVGHLDVNEWEKDGQKHSRVIIVVDNAYFGDSKRDGGNSAPAGGNGYNAPAGSNGYNAPAGGNGYGAPVGGNGYGAPAAQAGYGGFSAPAAPAGQPTGYAPASGGRNDFAVLDDEDVKLPF